MDKNQNEIDPKFLELLVCPLTHVTLDYNAGSSELICKKSKLAYPIREGIPILLPSEARHLEDQ